MAGMWFEDFEIGKVYRHPITRTVTQMDNMMFSCLTMNPQPLHIGDGTDRPDAVVDRSRSGIVEGQADKSVGLETIQNFVADRTVQHLFDMLDRTEQKRHCQHIHRRHEVADQRYIGAVDIDRADTGLLDGFLFLAELARMKHPHPVTATAALGDQAPHVAQRLHSRIFFALGIGDTKFPRNRTRRDRRLGWRVAARDLRAGVRRLRARAAGDRCRLRRREATAHRAVVLLSGADRGPVGSSPPSVLTMERWLSRGAELGRRPAARARPGCGAAGGRR